MSRIAPRLSFPVNNTLQNNDSQFNVELNFNSIKDFSPDAVIKQVEPLKNLIDTRVKLKTLLSKVDRSRELDTLLKEILQDNDVMTSLSGELKSDEDKESN